MTSFYFVMKLQIHVPMLKLASLNYFAHWKEDPVRYTHDIYMADISIRRVDPPKPYWSRDGTHYIAYI